MAEGVSAFVTPAFTDGKGNIIWSDLFGEYSLPINNPVPPTPPSMMVITTQVTNTQLATLGQGWTSDGN